MSKAEEESAELNEILKTINLKKGKLTTLECVNKYLPKGNKTKEKYREHIEIFLSKDEIEEAMSNV